TGRGRSSIASISRNAAVQEPTASASERIAAADVTFLFTSWRQPKTKSKRNDSSQGIIRRSRLSSRICSAGPKALRTSAGSRPSAIPSVIWVASSSSISRLTRSPRNRLMARDQNDMSHRPQDSVYRRSHSLPSGLLSGKLPGTLRSQPINAQPLPLVFRNPLGAQPTRFLHSVQGRVKRTFIGPQYVAGTLFDRGHDGIAMESWLAGQDLENQQIKRALEGVGSRHIETSQYRDVRVAKKIAHSRGALSAPEGSLLSCCRLPTDFSEEAKTKGRLSSRGGKPA